MVPHVTRTRLAVLCTLSLVLVTAVGCGASPVTSALTKVALGQMDTLTGTEILAVVDQFAPGTGLTEEQANDLAAFMAEHGIATLADFMPILKIVTGQIDTLSADDILTLGHKFVPDADLTEDQAEAAVEFLATNQVKTIDDLQALIEQAQADPDSVELPDGFEELFEGFDASMLPESFLM